MYVLVPLYLVVGLFVFIMTEQPAMMNNPDELTWKECLVVAVFWPIAAMIVFCQGSVKPLGRVLRLL